MKTEHNRRGDVKMLKVMTAALACCGALVASPAAMAQAPDPNDVTDAAQTVVDSLRGGVRETHEYICDENHPRVQEIVTGVQTALRTRFKTFEAMSTWGYAPYADAPLFGFSGRQGHWLNAGFVEDGHLMNPYRPEGILVDRWNRPIGVMFIADDPYVPGPDMYVAADGTPCNAWHYHTETLADAYWYAYKYGYSGDLREGKWQPPDRTPDLMHVWAYGATGGNYQYQWSHNTPPRAAMEADMAQHGMNPDPTAAELQQEHGSPPSEIGPGPRLPGMPPHP